MGENILETQAKNTKKRRQRQAASQQQGQLLQRSDQIVQEFTVECRDGKQTNPGDVLHCYPANDGSSVDVVRENDQIGTINGAGGGTLRELLQTAGCGRLVVSTSPDELTGTFKVELKKD